MPQITLDIPLENIPLLMEVTLAMGLETENILPKDQSPEWHQNILQERLEIYNSGKANLNSWEDIEKKMNEEDSVYDV
jgi:hypothetical protein